ncbi:precorrin-8X methylmutase [Synechococcus sp. PCC 7336]|uniref:precorrin-8X methylmutase n=1 Tax=Synechococcus sp. PCC 7336 TaxID=195250 RepID=UPI00034C54D1|nr:precorrin-8X methylmutase [Synechococcus sp. PCC 7336]
MHPIAAASFEIVDREIGSHSLLPAEYAIVRRAIHATADFELKHLFRFSPGAIAAGVAAIRAGLPAIVDVRMVAVAVAGALQQCPLHCAIEHVPDVVPQEQTRTEAGMRALAIAYPRAIFVVGNAPTALLALVELVQQEVIAPALIVGVPVGFVAVERSKAALAQLDVPHILVEGRKGGSPVAAATVNALVNLAYAN